MIGVGIDVAKVKSMVAILSDDGEVIKAPFRIANMESGFSFCKRYQSFAYQEICINGY